MFGRNAFAHKGGMHVAGVTADADTFEHIAAGAGRQPAARLLVSELAGRASVTEKAAAIGSSSTTATTAKVLERIKSSAPWLPVRGRRRLRSSCCCGARPAAMTAVHARVLARDRRATRRRCGADRATIKIWIDGERRVRTARAPAR